MTMGVLYGCTDTLFPENLPRSQYDRYSQLRGRDLPGTTAEAPLGMEKQVLRERLRPLSEP